MDKGTGGIKMGLGLIKVVLKEIRMEAEEPIRPVYLEVEGRQRSFMIPIQIQSWYVG